MSNVDDRESSRTGGREQLITGAKIISQLSTLLGDLNNEAELLDKISYNVLSNAGATRSEGISSKSLTLGRARRNMKETYNALNAIRTARSQFESMNADCFNRLERLKNTHGLALLPNEVLSIIFSFATHTPSPASDEPRALTALRLSHVCRRFRDNVITDPVLWTDIMTVGTPFVDMCIERSKQLPLHLSVNLYSMPVETTDQAQAPAPSLARVTYCDDSFTSLLEHTDRWKTLRFIEHSSKSGALLLSDAFKEIDTRTFPALERISGFKPRFLSSCQWKTPLLRTLATNNCLPWRTVNSLVYPGLTTINIVLTRMSDVYNLLGFLSTLRGIHLEELILDLSGLHMRVAGHIPMNQQPERQDASYYLRLVEMKKRLHMEAVRKFTFICATMHTTEENGNELKCLRRIISMLHFKNATEVTLLTIGSNVTSSDRGRGRQKLVEVKLAKIFSILFATVPNVVDCEIVINKISSRRLNTPLLYQFPKTLRNLRFFCNTEITMRASDRRAPPPLNFPSLSTLVMGVDYMTVDHAETSQEVMFQWVRYLVGGDPHCMEETPAALEELTILEAKNVEGAADRYEFIDMFSSPSGILEACDTSLKSISRYRTQNKTTYETLPHSF